MIKNLLVAVLLLFIAGCAISNIENVDSYERPIYDSIEFKKISFPNSFNGSDISHKSHSDYFRDILKKSEVDFNKDFINILLKEMNEHGVVSPLKLGPPSHKIEIRFWSVGMHFEKIVLQVSLRAIRLSDNVVEEAHADFVGTHNFHFPNLMTELSQVKRECEFGFLVLSRQLIKQMKEFDFDDEV